MPRSFTESPATTPSIGCLSSVCPASWNTTANATQKSCATLRQWSGDGTVDIDRSFAPTPSDLGARLHSIYLEDHLIQLLKNKIVDSYARLFGPAMKANMGWVYLGMLMLHLYILSIPRDPNAVSVDLKSRLSITYKSLADEIELQQIGELLQPSPLRRVTAQKAGAALSKLILPSLD
jgi:hypothetical protein